MTAYSVEDKVRFLREATIGAPDVSALRSDTRDGLGPPWSPVWGTLSDRVVQMHLAGEIEIGSYPLIPVDGGFPVTWWVAADFDGKIPGVQWERDVRRFTRYLLDVGANVMVNLSRSAKGAHVRVLFKEAVPAWMARRWMFAWLEEAGVAADSDFDGNTSFDRFIPPQDTLQSGLNEKGKREIGNLIGSPMNGRLARAYNGTLVLDPIAASLDRWEPDGKHWDHLVAALEGRAWGVDELRKALADTPGTPDLNPPAWRNIVHYDGQRRRLNVVPADSTLIQFTLHFCEFFRHASSLGQMSYTMWLALSTQLHHFGDEGHSIFHEISSGDPRYKYEDTEKMWMTTRDLPQKCTTIAREWRCPHLDTVRCAGAKAPAYFHEHAYYEPYEPPT